MSCNAEPVLSALWAGEDKPSSSRVSVSLAGDAYLCAASAPGDVDVHLPELAHQLVDRVGVDLGEIDVNAALAQVRLQARSGEPGNHGPETRSVADQGHWDANRDVTVAAGPVAGPHPSPTRMLLVIAGPAPGLGDGDAQILGGRSFAGGGSLPGGPGGRRVGGGQPDRCQQPVGFVHLDLALGQQVQHT